MADTDTTTNTESKSVSCDCVLGCDKCMPKAESKPQSKNVALKAMRAARPAKGITGSMVLEATTPGIQRKAGSKAGARVMANYKLGSTIDQMLAACPESDRSGLRADLVWDYQHGYITLK